MFDIGDYRYTNFTKLVIFTSLGIDINKFVNLHSQ